MWDFFLIHICLYWNITKPKIWTEEFFKRGRTDDGILSFVGNNAVCRDSKYLLLKLFYSFNKSEYVYISNTLTIILPFFLLLHTKQTLTVLNVVPSVFPDHQNTGIPPLIVASLSSHPLFLAWASVTPPFVPSQNWDHAIWVWHTHLFSPHCAKWIHVEWRLPVIYREGAGWVGGRQDEWMRGVQGTEEEPRDWWLIQIDCTKTVTIREWNRECVESEMAKHMLLCLHHQSKVVSSPGNCQALASLCHCVCVCDWLGLWLVSSHPIYIFRESPPLHHPFLSYMISAWADAYARHLCPQVCVVLPCVISTLPAHVCNIHNGPF